MSSLELEKLTTEPNNTPVGQIVAKVIMGFIIGLIIAFLVFVVTILFNTVIQQGVRAISTDSQVGGNPILPLIFMLIAFIASMSGNMLIGTVYNLLYNSKYYDLSKIMSLVSIANIVIFFIMAPVYMVFRDSILGLFIIVAFHVIFGVFISYSLMEFTSNPNYSGSNLIGGTIGFCITLLVFLAFYQSFGAAEFGLDNASTQKIKMLIAIPPLLSYTIIPFAFSLREKLYYKFYEMGNNFLYIPSLSEVTYDQATGQGTDGKDITEAGNDDDINVDLSQQ
ncbi:MAG: hypothetical protein WC004_01615 [Candidatus Absconditabacterales bacterium]